MFSYQRAPRAFPPQGYANHPPQQSGHSPSSFLPMPSPLPSAPYLSGVWTPFSPPGLGMDPQQIAFLRRQRLEPTLQDWDNWDSPDYDMHPTTPAAVFTTPHHFVSTHIEQVVHAFEAASGSQSRGGGNTRPRSHSRATVESLSRPQSRGEGPSSRPSNAPPRQNGSARPNGVHLPSDILRMFKAAGIDPTAFPQSLVSERPDGRPIPITDQVFTIPHAALMRLKECSVDLEGILRTHGMAFHYTIEGMYVYPDYTPEAECQAYSNPLGLGSQQIEGDGGGPSAAPAEPRIILTRPPEARVEVEGPWRTNAAGQTEYVGRGGRVEEVGNHLPLEGNPDADGHEDAEDDHNSVSSIDPMHVPPAPSGRKRMYPGGPSSLPPSTPGIRSPAQTLYGGRSASRTPRPAIRGGSILSRQPTPLSGLDMGASFFGGAGISRANTPSRGSPRTSDETEDEGGNSHGRRASTVRFTINDFADITEEASQPTQTPATGSGETSSQAPRVQRRSEHGTGDTEIAEQPFESTPRPQARSLPSRPPASNVAGPSHTGPSIYALAPSNPWPTNAPISATPSRASAQPATSPQPHFQHAMYATEGFPNLSNYAGPSTRQPNTAGGYNGGPSFTSHPSAPRGQAAPAARSRRPMSSNAVRPAYASTPRNAARMVPPEDALHHDCIKLVEETLADTKITSESFQLQSVHDDFMRGHVVACSKIEGALGALRLTLQRRAQFTPEQWELQSQRWQQRFLERLLSLKTYNFQTLYRILYLSRF
ncbi:hypothetical protein BDQ12DRAFT_742648 [Crucibulum laeve]|uniref:Uncharacterized protein n=1 Tax=Crucibulum laeve TaxID=68775 RepID=A0A5C3MHZ6_9AGAR|nr:hypothetical protein BDQ12DRAFT_742648 [Crucibulum laeve]